MKKILLFISIFISCFQFADAAERGTNSTSRTKSLVAITPQRNTRSKTSRSAIKTTVSPRVAKPVSVLTPKTKNISTRGEASSTTPRTKNSNSSTQKVVSRAAATTAVKKETKTGAAYEQCKTSFFTCMDQFCQLKNDNFRRCSCSDRVFGFQSISENYQNVSERLTEFSENLQSVGMTREQATAMKTASEGEDALTEDKSASKQLLQAIMDAIKGEKTSMGGKYKDLNSVEISMDMSNAFGMEDSGQVIASYNGATLYKAVYPKCRKAVTEDCNSASLQRAINAYLMAIEQDCNTVEAALQNKQKTLKASTKQSSAMLDLARVENHQNHNSADVATCLINVENAILSEEVCGAKYHKCLDYGQFIDVTTGAPLTGVADFYKLGQLLTFKNTDNIKDQKLSTVSSNRTFVQFFENKTKKFAKDALDNCADKADDVWQQYLDRALLEIYYSQQAKVDEIQQSCIDLVKACYENQTTSITNAMSKLSGDSALALKPSIIELTSDMCSDYIDSCNNMFANFAGNVVQNYLANKDSTDSVTACRAVAQQCFDKFGGSGYENFYNPHSGLFEEGAAIDWFSLYKYEKDPQTNEISKEILSPCAKELSKTDGCKDIVERVFGGFNKYINSEGNAIYTYTSESEETLDFTTFATLENRTPRTRGIATEIYYGITNTLSSKCNSLNGYFIEQQFVEQYSYYAERPCWLNTTDLTSDYYWNEDVSDNKNYISYWYHFLPQENVCPANYEHSVDTVSWGACSCWENGGLRSKNGQSQTCRPMLPIKYSEDAKDQLCTEELLKESITSEELQSNYVSWCQNSALSSLGQVCPKTTINVEQNIVYCSSSNSGSSNTKIESVDKYVPHHKKDADTSSEQQSEDN